MAIYGDVIWQARHQLHKQSVKALLHTAKGIQAAQVWEQEINWLSRTYSKPETLDVSTPTSFIDNKMPCIFLAVFGKFVLGRALNFRVKWFKNNRDATVNFVAACSSSAAFKKRLFADILITYISYYSIVYIPYFLYLAFRGHIFPQFF